MFVIIRSPIEVGFNSENSVADLPVVPDLASPDEYAVVVSVAEVAQEERFGYVTVSPGSANVAAKIKSGPTERRRRVDRRRGGIWSRPRSHVRGRSVLWQAKKPPGRGHCNSDGTDNYPPM